MEKQNKIKTTKKPHFCKLSRVTKIYKEKPLQNNKTISHIYMGRKGSLKQKCYKRWKKGKKNKGQ